MSIDRALGRLESTCATAPAGKLRDDINLKESPEFIEDSTTREETGPRTIVRHKTFTTRPMSAEDAALQMELLGHSFVYIDSELCDARAVPAP